MKTSLVGMLVFVAAVCLPSVALGATMTGTLYQADGVTVIADKRVNVSVSGGAVGTQFATTSGAGTFSVTFAGSDAGTPVVVYVDNDATTRAALVTKATSSSDIVGVALYEDTVIVSQESGATSTTNIDFGTGSLFDTDIPFNGWNGTTTIATSTRLWIWTGKTFAPGQSVTMSGDFVIATSSTFIAPATMSVGGSYTNNGTFTAGTSTVTFNSPLFQYLTGIDASASVGAGVGNSATNAVVVSGNYAYVASAGSATLCSSSAGSGIGCELKIFDMSNPAEPTYVTGVDASGSIATGTANVNFTGVYISGNYAYVTSAGSATACSSSADSGVGCELKIFDISNPAAPTYVAGIDVTTAVGSGTGNLGLNKVYVSGNYAYVMSAASATACSSSASSGIGCEVKIFDISSPAAPTYAAGIDASASVGSGSGSVAANDIVISGDYMYAAFAGSATGCNVTTGCELKIFNISNPAAPTYLVGVDSSASLNSGVGSIDFKSAAVSGNYLYVAGSSNTAACNKSVGGASGCEFQVYDISSPAVPFLAAAVDASGSLAGGSFGGATLNGISISGDYAYIVSSGDSTTCASDAHSAIGCELKVFNISNPLAPLYFAGIDATGLGTGTGSATFNGVYISGNYVYVGATGHGTACNSGAGSAIGCEFKVVQHRAATPATLSGVLDGASSFNNINFALATAYQISNPVSAVNFNADGYVRIPVAISVDRDYYGTSLVDFTDGTLSMTNSAAERTVPIPVAIAGIDASGSTNAGLYGVNAVSTFIAGNYLYAIFSASSAACTATAGSALGCELKIYDISNAATPVYLSGIDASGSTNAGSGSVSPGGVFVSGNYAYLVQSGNSTDCSSVAGSAIGCEFQIYDVSNPAAPSLVVGVDASGTVGSGTTSNSFYEIFISGNYAYIAANGGATACSSVAGSAAGCELLIFDVSNPAAPSLVAGVDGSGTVGSGTTINAIFNVFVSGDYAYAVSNTSSAACSNAVGSATGCEVKIFNISSSTAPLYVAGMDASGSVNSGTTGQYALTGIYVSGNYAYTSNAQNVTVCSGAAGSAVGCEVKIFDISSSTAPVYVAGIDTSGSVNSGVASAAARRVTVAGNYLYVAISAGNTAPCNSAAGSAIGCELQIYDISNPVAPFYVSGADTTGSTGVAAGRGTGVSGGNAIAVSGDYAYLSRTLSSTDCAELGSQLGCEVIIFDLKPDSVITGGSLASLSMVGASTTTLLAPATLSGTFENSSIFRADGASSFSVAGDFSNTGTVYAPSALTLGGDYANTGTAIFDAFSASEFNGTTTQSLSGNMTGTSTFGPITFSGAGAKTFVNNASTTSFTVDSGSTVSAPSLLSIDGAYQNDGTFNALSGTIFFTGDVGGLLVGSIDGGGAAAGAISANISELFILGNYAYTTSTNSASACSNTAGSALGCEFRIFDISSSTAPTYVAGIDASGSTGSGTGNVSLHKLHVSGNYAYVAQGGDATACSNNAGSAIGCELKIFDISSSTAPTYVAGIDASGSVGDGTGNNIFQDVFVSGNYVYVTTGFNDTECTNTAGSGIGCELKVFDISNPLSPLYVAGVDASGTIGSGTASSTFGYIFKNGNYLYVTAGVNATECSSSIGSAIGCDLKIFDISSSTVPTYVAGIDASGSVGTGTAVTANFTSIAFSGNYMYAVKSGISAEECTSVAGSALGCEFMVYDISDPTAPVYIVGADASGTIGSGYGSVTFNTIVLSGTYAYVSSSALTATCSNAIGAALACEVKIFDISNPSSPAYIAGIDASGTVGSGTVTATHQSLFISGNYLYVGTAGNATACSSTVGSALGCELKVYLLPNKFTGTVTGNSALYGANVNGNYIFSVNASTTNLSIAENASVTAPSLLDIAGDYANQGTFKAGTGRVYLSGTTTQTISGDLTANSTFYDLTISNASMPSSGTSSIVFMATTSVANIFTMMPGTSAQFAAGATSTFQQIDWQGTEADIIYVRSTVLGSPWRIAVPGSRTLSYVYVRDSNACSGYSDIDGGTGSATEGNNFCWTLGTPVVSGGTIAGGGAIGGDAPAGQGTVGGGSGSGGEDIGGLPGFFAPMNSGAATGFASGWTNAGNAYASDNVYATALSMAASDFYDFSFSIPAGDQITGIAIRLESKASSALGSIAAELSWNGGAATTTSSIVTSTQSTSDTVYELGNASSLWGRSWVPGEFTNPNFRVRLIALPSSNTISLDAIQVRVYHQATGGGGGGGGGGEI